ncbi:MAG: MBL fold metallo-hydrolase [bacterium]|nr:MBL fold metallo-hydrolase [bacterium]
MRQLSEHLYAETAYSWANVGAAVTEAGVLLLDCPVRPTDSKDWLEKLGALSPTGIRYLIATDYHGDHTTGSAFVPEVEFIAPRYVFDEIAKGDNDFSKKIFVETLRDQGCAEEADAIAAARVPLPRICFEDALNLYLPPLTFEIRRLGGHSPACSSVYVPEEGVLFSGDIVINGPSPGMRDANAAEWLAALDWVEALPVETIVPGHGEICGMEVVRRLRDYIGGMRADMVSLLEKGMDREDAVREDVFGKYFESDDSRGAYWSQQRKDTFRAGLERLYDEVRAG